MVVEDNPFVRFKNHIDTNIRRGWDVLVAPITNTLNTTTTTTTTTATTATTSSPSPSPSAATTATTTPPTAATSTTTPSPLTPPPPPSSSSSSSPSPSSSPVPKRSFFRMPSFNSTSDKASSAATSIPPPSSSDSSPSTLNDVHSWALHSPYSPLNLEHLRPPRPSDAPSSCDGTFSFADAFEDLLVAGSGAPLSLSSRTAAWKKCLSSSTAGPGLARVRGGEKEEVWWRLRQWVGNDAANSLRALDWACGLGQRGLWEAYFPAVVVTTPTTVAVNVNHRRAAYRDDWERFRARKSLGLVFPGWGVDVNVDVDVDDDDDDYMTGEADVDVAGALRAGGVFGNRDSSRAAWERTWRRGWGVDSEDEKDGEGRREEYRLRRHHRPADFEDELYKAFDSAFFRPDPNREKSVPFRTHPYPLPLPEEQQQQQQERLPPSSEPVTTTTRFSDGTKLVRTSQRTERDGKVEFTKTESLYDAQGNLISETHGVSKQKSWSGSLPGGNAGASVSWSWNSSGSSSGSGSGSNGDAEAEGSADKKDEKNGWFWKR